MRRFITLAVVTTLIAALAPFASAGAAPQEETGTVALPAPGPNGETTGGCWTGWARRTWILTGGATGGPLGSMFEIDKATWGGPFKLEVLSGAAGSEDLDITFYADPGKLDPGDPAQQAGILQTGAYLTREAGGETGVVPPTSTVALICLGTGTGFEAEWEYVAAPAKKKKK